MDSELRHRLMVGLDKMPKLILVPLVLTAVENFSLIKETNNEEAKKIANSFIEFAERISKIWSEKQDETD